MVQSLSFYFIGLKFLNLYRMSETLGNKKTNLKVYVNYIFKYIFLCPLGISLDEKALNLRQRGYLLT